MSPRLGASPPLPSHRRRLQITRWSHIPCRHCAVVRGAAAGALRIAATHGEGGCSGQVAAGVFPRAAAQLAQLTGPAECGLPGTQFLHPLHGLSGGAGTADRSRMQELTLLSVIRDKRKWQPRLLCSRCPAPF